MRIVSVAALVAVVLTGCTRDPERTAHDTPEAVNVTVLRPFELNSVEVTVTDVSDFLRTPEREDVLESFPVIAVSMRVENNSTVVDKECVEDVDGDGDATSVCTRPRDSFVPNLELRCAGVEAAGEVFAGGTIEAGGYLPMGSVAMGRVFLGFPSAPDDLLSPVESCDDAQVYISHRDGTEGRFVTAVLPIEESMVEAALAAAEGPPRPLGRRPR